MSHDVKYIGMDVHKEAIVSCLSWNRRKRSFVKITERTYEKRAHALHGRRESRHPEATPLRQGPGFRSV